MLNSVVDSKNDSLPRAPTRTLQIGITRVELREPGC